MFKTVFATILFCCFAYMISSTTTGCANIVPPVGGPKDSIAPKLLKVTPADKALNVNGRTIIFNFDEYIELEDPNNKVIVSPLPVLPPEISKKLKTVTIRLKDSLAPNTTYSISINGAIKDVNEGNKLNNLVFTFSTGAYIDSNTLEGNVILAESGKVDTTLLVVLYTGNLDSTVIKEKPKYYTNLNSKGDFFFKNLPAKNFSIYTIKDEGNQKKYMSKTQLFGFYDKPVDAAKNEKGINLYAYAEEKETAKPGTERKPAAGEKLRIANSLSNGRQDILKDLVLTFNKKITTADVNLLMLTDTNFIKKDPVTTILDSVKNTITIKTAWQPEQGYRLVIPAALLKDDKGNSIGKSDTLKFVTNAKKDYGNVVIRFNKIDLEKNPVLQIIQNELVLNSYPLRAFKLTIPLYPPGEYDLRLLFDENKNGIWDPGTFFTVKKQPEKVSIIPKKLTVKADWDNDLELD